MTLTTTAGTVGTTTLTVGTTNDFFNYYVLPSYNANLHTPYTFGGTTTSTTTG